MAKKPRNKKPLGKQAGPPQTKDDGSRWQILGENGKVVYPGEGSTRSEAERLGGGLLQPSQLKMVKPPEGS